MNFTRILNHFTESIYVKDRGLSPQTKVVASDKFLQRKVKIKDHAPWDSRLLYISCCNTLLGERHPRTHQSPASSCSDTRYSPCPRHSHAQPSQRCPSAYTCIVCHTVISLPFGDCWVPRTLVWWLESQQKTVPKWAMLPSVVHRRPLSRPGTRTHSQLTH